MFPCKASNSTVQFLTKLRVNKWSKICQYQISINLNITTHNRKKRKVKTTLHETPASTFIPVPDTQCFPQKKFFKRALKKKILKFS